jgi:hypothetical protein
MIKYSFKSNPSTTNYWDYCQKHHIPYIEVTDYEDGYADISYDLLPCLPFHHLNTDLSGEVIKIYEAYFIFFNLPEEHFNIAGGAINMGIKVRTEHAEFIAGQLFDYLTEFINKHKSIN